MPKTYNVLIHKNGATVKRSKNLRGILDYAREEPVVKASVVVDKDGSADIVFTFLDGAKSLVHFASNQVFQGWILKRRSWGKPSRKYITDFWYILEWV